MIFNIDDLVLPRVNFIPANIVGKVIGFKTKNVYENKYIIVRFLILESKLGNSEPRKPFKFYERAFSETELIKFKIKSLFKIRINRYERTY